VPATPAGLAAAAGDGKVTLSWSAVAGARSYNVKRSLVAGGPYATVASPATATYVDTAVTNDVAYYYVVSAVNGLGESADSAEATATPKRPADLVVSALTVPASGGAGQAIVVTDTTRNQAAGVAAPSTTRFYFSTNMALDAADVLLDGSRAVPSLGGGASSAGSTSVTIPSGLTAGTYYVIAKADADGVVGETSETNNAAARVISVGPDLVVSALQVPSTVAAGAVVSVGDTTKNQGAGVAAPSTTRFYLSSNATLDAADVLLDGSRPVPSLGGGASSAGATSVTIPSGLASGTYYVIAKADADGAVGETSETNNTAARAVSLGADLLVSSMQVPTTAAAGAVVSVSDTTKNQGAGVAAPTTTRFYLSTNITLDAADILLDGSRIVPALAGGASSAGSTSVTIPSGLTPGTYYLIAKADADGVVGETLETNNTGARTIQMVASSSGVLTVREDGTSAMGAVRTDKGA
jgi:subtilase family serine protease